LAPPTAPETFAIGCGPVTFSFPGHGSIHDPRLHLVNVFDIVNLESKQTGAISDGEWELVMNSLDNLDMTKKLKAGGVAGSNGLADGLPSRICEEAARLGRTDLVEHFLATGFPGLWRDTDASLPNHINMFVGTAPDWQWEGPLALGLSETLLQSVSARPGGDSVIRVFPAWPKARDAVFSLRVSGDFLVTSAMHSGQIPFVEIQPARRGICQIRNPWGTDQAVDVWRNGVKQKAVSGDLLTLKTKPGEDLVFVRAGESPEELKLSVPVR
jgi:hypothetical protein